MTVNRFQFDIKKSNLKTMKLLGSKNSKSGNQQAVFEIKMYHVLNQADK